jgi:glutamate dehydrogenase
MSREIFGMVSLWLQIEALDNIVDDAVQSQMLIEISRQLERGTKWFLRSKRLTEDIGATIVHFRPGVEALAVRLPELIAPDERARMDSEIAHYVQKGVPRALAERVVSFGTLYATLDIAEIAGTAGRPVEQVAAVYFDVANRLGMGWLREKIAALPGDQHWQMLAKGAMLDDLSGLQRSIAATALAGRGNGEAPSATIASWQSANKRALERTSQLMSELRTQPAPDAAMLSVALRELRGLG